MACQGGAQGQLRQVELLAACPGRGCGAHLRKPVLPLFIGVGAVPGAAVVQQPVAVQVLRLGDGRVAGQELGAGHGDEPFVQKHRGVQVAVAAQVEAHGGFDAIAHHAGAVQGVEFAKHAQAGVRVLAKEVAQPGREPAHGKRG
ncbi:hypothetical protein D3C71_1267720 [compost metagenome]